MWAIGAGASKLDELEFSDDLNIILDNKETVVNNTATLVNKAKTVGLIVNMKNRPKEPNGIIRRRP